MLTTVFIAGYGNSTQGHWQRSWYEHTPNSIWVEQKDWDNPNRNDWVAMLDAVLSRIETPIFIVAHSLGCNTFVEWCAEQPSERLVKVKGALLVAYPDVLDKSFPAAILGFSSPPLAPLIVPSVAIASSDDPYITLERAEYFARCWHAEFIHAGALGHINIASNIQDWPQGKAYLAEFKKRLYVI